MRTEWTASIVYPQRHSATLQIAGCILAGACYLCVPTGRSKTATSRHWEQQSLVHAACTRHICWLLLHSVTENLKGSVSIHPEWPRGENVACVPQCLAAEGGRRAAARDAVKLKAPGQPTGEGPFG